jgi:hypothetical protein
MDILYIPPVNALYLLNFVALARDWTPFLRKSNLDFSYLNKVEQRESR